MPPPGHGPTAGQRETQGLHLSDVCCFPSAGVGRTGVFITLSIVLERMRYEGVVDLFQTVKTLRTQRPAMVQTEERAEQPSLGIMSREMLSLFPIQFINFFIYIFCSFPSFRTSISSATRLV